MNETEPWNRDHLQGQKRMKHSEKRMKHNEKQESFQK